MPSYLSEFLRHDFLLMGKTICVVLPRMLLKTVLLTTQVAESPSVYSSALVCMGSSGAVIKGGKENQTKEGVT